MRSLSCLSLAILAVLSGPGLAQEAAPPPAPANGPPSAPANPGPELLRPHGKRQPVTEQVFVSRREAALMRADKDGDGRISRAEWIAFASERGAKGHPDRQFARFDTNHNGYLDKGEIDAMLAQRFAKRDTNGDGLLTPDERQHRASAKP